MKVFGSFEAHIERNIHNGVAYRFRFDNGYGASVVSHDASYGGDEGLWEVAVLNRRGELDYTTPVTDDVVGWLDEEEVAGLLARIAALVDVPPLPSFLFCTTCPPVPDREPVPAEPAEDPWIFPAGLVDPPF